jgi:predicted nucleic acid-binding protein
VIAVDASIALKLVLHEPDSALVRAAWQRWTDAGDVLVAPPLFRAETLSVVRRKVHQGILSAADGDRARQALEDLVVEVREPADLYDVAWQLAVRFNRPTVYDCCYLALALLAGCELWTADQRLARAVDAQLAWVRPLAAEPG